MGRFKVRLKKIENKTYRHITFAKRKSGLIKKAYELSTLCDVEVALIIFSPAGKLFLFDGKKRLEEILAHFIDHPVCERGRVRNQESIRRMVNKMSFEAGYENCPTISSFSDITDQMDMDSQLEEIQGEILICSTQLEDLEKQLRYFLRNPSCFETTSEARYHEVALEETLKRVQLRKRILEAKCGTVQPTSQQIGDNIRAYLTSCQEASSNNNMSLQPQNDDLQSPRDYTQPNRLRPSRNLPEIENDISQGHPYLTGDEVNIQAEMDGHFPHMIWASYIRGGQEAAQRSRKRGVE